MENVDLSLHDALRAAGFRPRDASRHPGGPDQPAIYYSSNHRARRMRGIPKGTYLDHREEWTLGDVRTTALTTWHIHGCLTSGQVPYIPGAPTPLPVAKWGWYGPSWYAPRAIVGIAWTEQADEVVERGLARWLIQRGG